MLKVLYIVHVQQKHAKFTSLSIHLALGDQAHDVVCSAADAVLEVLKAKV
jgi:hypothetical protein